MTRPLAVAIHDVEPRTYERCRHIRDWLDERGVERATLLVIPAADLHPFDRRSPDLADWIALRVRLGDAVAQHGFQHRSRRPQGPLRRWQGGMAAEFPGLSAEGTREAVDAGRRILAAAGVDARGFVAPGYAYTPRLRRVLEGRFEWWAGLIGLHTAGNRGCIAPACCLGTSGRLKRALSPPTVRALARGPGPLLRVDVHPADFDHPRHVSALERLIDGHPSVTYDEAVAA